MAINIIVRFGGFSGTSAAEVVAQGSGEKSVQLVDSLREEGKGATGKRSAAFGRNTLASGQNAFAEGQNTTASGLKAHAEGTDTEASGENSHAEGDATIAEGVRAHAEGNKTEAIGDSSHTEGSGTVATGVHAHAEGGHTQADGKNAHAEGDNTIASGDSSHAGGTSGTNASGFASFAHGSGCRAVTKHSVAMGLDCVAGDGSSDEIGDDLNPDAFAMGIDNHATHKASAVFGVHNRSSRNYQTVVGKNNQDDQEALFVVGNGDEPTQRSNAFVVRDNGDVVAAGDVISGNVNITNILNTLSPKIPENFGGIVCLTLGQTISAANLQTIMQVLSSIMATKKHYIITIYDTVENKFFGDCEVVQMESSSFGIITNYVSTTLTACTIYYSFGKNTGEYKRNKYSVSIASKCSVTALEKEVAVQTCVELMIYNQGLYVIAPNGYIDPNNTDVEFARYVKTSSRYKTPVQTTHRKKKGWVTPRSGIPYPLGTNNYPTIVYFVLEERTAEFKHISTTNRQIFEVVFSEENEYIDPGYDIAYAFTDVIRFNNNSNTLKLTNMKLGIRLIHHDSGIPFTDWMPFKVRSNASGYGLSRWM